MSLLPGSIELPDALAGLGVVLVVVSVPLSWITAEEAFLPANGALTDSLNGWQFADGQVVIIAVGLLMLVAMIDYQRRDDWGRLGMAVAALAGIVAALISGVYLADPTMAVEGEPALVATVEAGPGLYVIFFGGLLLVASAALAYWSPS